MVSRVAAYVRARTRNRQVNRELDDELQFHLAQQVDAHVAAGMSVSDAKRTALRDFGGVSQTRDAVRDVRRLWFESVWRDLQLAIRLLRKEAAFTVTVGLTLALCLGVNAALFAIVDHVLLRPLAIPESDRVVITGNRYPKAGVDSGYSTSAADYVDRLRDTDVFEEQALFKIA